MYVSELGLWLGWAVWYGSVGVLIGFAIALIVLTAAAQYEEGVLDARFGDAFRAYRSTVPRWFGARVIRNRDRTEAIQTNGPACNSGQFPLCLKSR
jgi:hypothetical protein